MTELDISGPTRIMGVVNVTPDSFSDGGQHDQRDDAISHALRLIADGADIIDVGGESTRPGATRVTVAEELRRVLPVVEELAAQKVAVSVDTMNAETAARAAQLGARYINDVSGGLADERMTATMIDLDLPWVVMHWRGHSATMNTQAKYHDTVGEVRGELMNRVTELIDSGVNPARLILDPGLGFAKKSEHNWQILAALDEFVGEGMPILIGASRKRFITKLLGPDADNARRDEATATVTALAAQHGIWGVRVHDVAKTRTALDVVEAWQSGARS